MCESVPGFVDKAVDTSVSWTPGRIWFIFCSVLYTRVSKLSLGVDRSIWMQYASTDPKL